MMLRFTGDDPAREGLLETPERVADAYLEWFSGYGQDPKAILKTFKDGSQGYDEMVLVANTPVYSFCEHHIAPFWGLAHIAYIPSGKILGLSKFVRLVDVFSRRLQVQERLTNQIADSLQECLRPLGIGVVLECRHMCLESRGVRARGSVTVTSSLRGVMKDVPTARAEFLSLVAASSEARGGL